MEDSYKEVYFGQYCRTCIHFELGEDEDPCHDCLNNSVNVYSHKPVNWESEEED